MTIDILAGPTRIVRSSPHFSAAALEYIDNFLEWRQQMSLLNKLFSSHMRAQIVAFVLYTHFASEIDPAEEGPTFNRLLSLCKKREEGSPRALKTLLGVLRIAGMARLVRSERDGRLFIYQPTDKMIAFAVEWYERTLKSMDVLFPGGRYSYRVRAEDGFLQNLFVSAGRVYLEEDIQVGRFSPDLWKIMSNEGGCAMAAYLTQAAIRGHQPRTADVINRRWGASKSQARLVLKQMQRLGLVEVADDHRIIGLATLRDVYEGMIARELALYCRFGLGLFGDDDGLPVPPPPLKPDRPSEELRL